MQQITNTVSLLKYQWNVQFSGVKFEKNVLRSLQLKKCYATLKSRLKLKIFTRLAFKLVARVSGIRVL